MAAKKPSALPQREKRVRANELFTTPLTKGQQAELHALARMPDSEIDLSDAPPVKDPGKIFVGRFYRPIKQAVSLRVDADVLAWFRGRGKKYQTYMNEVLRREMQGAGRSR